VIGASILLGLLRGFMREMISLAGWIAASGWPFASPYRSARRCRSATTGRWRAPPRSPVLIVVGCRVRGGAGRLAAARTGQGGQAFGGRSYLGGLFGLARGLLIIGLAVFLVRDTALYHEPLWRESLVMPADREAALAFALRPVARRGDRAGRRR